MQNVGKCGEHLFFIPAAFCHEIHGGCWFKIHPREAPPEKVREYSPHRLVVIVHRGCHGTFLHWYDPADPIFCSAATSPFRQYRPQARP
jgi:hypothetical protein